MSERDGDRAFEALLAECIERYGEGGTAEVEALLERHPGSAPRLRSRLADLQRLGFLGEPRDEALPERIGRFRVLERLGLGGMSVVYRALDPRAGREVALKASLATLGGDERARVRFEREAAAVAQLDHPNLVPLLEVGEAEGRPFFTMQYVPGATLDRVIAELRRGGRPFGQLGADDLRGAVLAVAPACPHGGAVGEGWGATHVEAACRIALDLAAALDHAHTLGVVHRDVKPSNVLLAPDGRARLFDFGLAHLADQPGLTRSGDFAGTPYYVSPEQLRGRRGELDARTDVYSLGVTLYELLALRRPFEGSGTAEVFRRILSAEPTPLRRVNPMVPADLETVVHTALEKDAARRYPSTAELAADLQRFLAFQPVRARPVSALRRATRFARRNPGWAAALGLAALVAVGVPVGLAVANALIRDQRDRAEQAALEAQHSARLSARVVEYLVGLFEATAEGERRPEERTARELLDQGAARLPTVFQDDPAVRAALMAATARVYANLGLFDEAVPLFDRAWMLQRRQARPSDGIGDAAGLDTLARLSDAHLEAGHGAEAADLAQRALEALDAEGRGQGELAARCRTTLGRALAAQGDLPGATRELNVALSRWRALEPEPGAGTAEALAGLGAAALAAGDALAASAHAEEALAVQRGLWSPDPTALAAGQELCAAALEARGEAARAAELRAEAADLRAALRGAAPLGGAEALPPYPWSWLPPWRPEYDAHFQDGITALQRQRWSEAIEAFGRCLELAPREPVCAYNVACANAQAGDGEAALEWLERAADWGFGTVPSRLAVFESDPEIAAVRDTPRGRALDERMRAELERVRAYAGTPGVLVPDGAAPDEPLPLIVVLHAEGESKDAVLAGPWAALAREHGAALLAPSGAVPAGGDPAQGMHWSHNRAGLARRPDRSLEPVREALRWFEERRAIDRRHVVLVGEGEGGLLAWELALEAPGLFRGLVLVDAAPAEQHDPSRAAVAAALGLRVEVVLTDPARVEGYRRWMRAVWRGPLGVHGAPASERGERLREALAAVEGG